jgi:leader peptidase (prepilin peptidase)/N-methyltransferase
MTAPLLVGAAAELGEWYRVRDALVTAAVAFAVFFAINFVYPRGLGFGDVRLSFLLGLALGWQRPLVAFSGLFMGFFLGAVIGMAGIAISKAGRKAEIPFGPFLAAGTYIALLYGYEITDVIFPTLAV